MKKIFASFVLAFLLSACADNPAPVTKVATDSSPKINLDVLTVVVLDRSNPLDSNTPYATNNFQPTIANALRRWATDKLIAVGSTGEAIVAIQDASLTSESLRHPDSIFTRQQASKYVGHAAIEIDVTGREGHGRVTAEASQMQTLPEDPTTAERQDAYAKLLNALMKQLSENVRSGVRDHLGNFVITAPILPSEQ